MVIIMVHWLIKRGVENEHAFKALWAKMSIDPNTGLYREVLTKPVEAEDSKFNTFSITDNAYITYINIGFWKDIESFDVVEENTFNRRRDENPWRVPTRTKKCSQYTGMISNSRFVSGLSWRKSWTGRERWIFLSRI